MARRLERRHRPHRSGRSSPGPQLWATHTGGHQQIGCIYTAQGLEHHHAGVIIGPDLTWTNGR
ncbi:DUF2075 domain-containing protein [Streptomyces platensis]|uniref:DNA/RNA helicase domain-containing protein n=1 Tax=Streptomyces platensis TaxID=58346 RepID=UPI0030DF91C6